MLFYVIFVVCLFDYVFVAFTSKCFYLFFMYFIHVFSLELVHERSLKLVGLMKESFQAKECKLGVFTSHQPLHESSPFLAVSSHQSLHESSPFIFCQELQLFSFEQFSYFGNNFFYRYPNKVIKVDIQR